MKNSIYKKKIYNEARDEKSHVNDSHYFNFLKTVMNEIIVNRFKLFLKFENILLHSLGIKEKR
jgi:hypothetical protein